MFDVPIRITEWCLIQKGDDINYIYVYKVRTIHSPYLCKGYEVYKVYSTSCSVYKGLHTVQFINLLKSPLPRYLELAVHCPVLPWLVHLRPFGLLNGWMALAHVTHGALQPGRWARQLRAKAIWWITDYPTVEIVLLQINGSHDATKQ